MISVRLEHDRCKGCTTCVKQCPTEAIRVRAGCATIIHEKCIDCGHCVRVCPHHAKKAVADPLSELSKYRYNIVLPAPALYAQFRNLGNINIVLQALLAVGFDDIFEPASAAEIVSHLTVEMLKEGRYEKPLISAACPAVVRLIRQRFPNLIPHIVNFIAPVELAAKIARERAVEKTGLRPSEIGICFVTPCPAKVTEAHDPSGLQDRVIDYAVSMTEMYLKLLPHMRRGAVPSTLQSAGFVGVGWATAGGESSPLSAFNAIAVDGLPHVINLLESIEDDKLPEIEYLELNACTQGCVGGCLAIENPFVARERIHKLMQALPKTETEYQLVDDPPDQIYRTKRLMHVPTTILDQDFGKAMQKLRSIEALKERLPGLDCGSCGTPGCHALAEDVILGFAEESDCIFNVRARMREDDAIDDEQYLPPPFRRSRIK